MPLSFVEKQGGYSKFDLEKPNFCWFSNLCVSFYLFGNLLQNYDLSGEIFAIYFICLKDLVFLKIII